jgi:hypothetical protein
MRTYIRNNINDLKEGVIYKDRHGGSYILAFCKICNKPRIAAIRRGSPITDICISCFNRTPEKRAIMSKAHKGIPFSPDTIRKRIEAYNSPDNYHKSQEYRAKISIAGKGRVVSEETRNKIRLANKGQRPTEKCLDAQKEALRSIFSDTKRKNYLLEKMRIGRENISPFAEVRRRDKIRISSKERWANKEYKERVVMAILKGRAMRPTIPEIKLYDILQRYYPNQWIYNGDSSGDVIIGGLVPDFVNVNGKKQVIELFGVYFHTPSKYIKVSSLRTEDCRVAKFKEYGFDCIVIWDKDLRDENIVLSKLGCLQK